MENRNGIQGATVEAQAALRLCVYYMEKKGSYQTTEGQNTVPFMDEEGNVVLEWKNGEKSYVLGITPEGHPTVEVTEGNKTLKVSYPENPFGVLAELAEKTA